MAEASNDTAQSSVPNGTLPATTGSSAGTSSDSSSKAAAAADTVKEGAAKLTRQASDRARGLAEQGKAKATGALTEFSRLMEDAAGSVDQRLGEDYGGYARSAAQTLAGFANDLDAKDIDELLEDVRAFVKKSPAIAVGTAAAIGFVLARLVKAGSDGDATSHDAS
jgi:ElaB/YqjD/DUF883 family membrane-anchored ribosome-binding protein